MQPSLQLAENEQLIYQCQPSHRYVFYWLLVKTWRQLVAMAIIMILATSYLSSDQKNLFAVIIATLFSPHIALIFPIITLFIFIGYFLLKLNLDHYWYFFTTKRIILYRGFITIDKKVISYDNIVDVSMRQFPVERILYLATVTLAQRGLVPSTSRGQQLNYLNGLCLDDANRIISLISQQLS